MEQLVEKLTHLGFKMDQASFGSSDAWSHQPSVLFSCDTDLEYEQTKEKLESILSQFYKERNVLFPI